MHDPASLRLESVTVNFGGLRALSNVTIEINPGEVVGIIGPNGAGKTTLFNVLSGIVAPSSGTFFAGGVHRSWPQPHQLTAHGVARTLQGVGLFSELTVLENLLVGATLVSKPNFLKSLLGLNKNSEIHLTSRADEMLKELEIDSYRDALASALPYPITKRVALARALMSEPSTLLLDEPAGGLGVEDINWLKDFVIKFRAEKSVLLVEHHMDVIMSVCDRIYVLNFGELIAHGTPEEIRENPAVIAAYLGSEAQR
jgi:branched-chain amino acid transport system ATP-binding protein